MKRLHVLAALAAVGVLGVTSCGNSGRDINDDSLPTVKVGLHQNLGAGAGYSAYGQGFMKANGVNFEAVLGEGPSLATQVIQGQIDVSFMGNGVAWNYFAENSKIKLVALDNLTNDDRLFVNTDKITNLSINSTLEDIGNALKGKSIAFDQKATPASFWTSLVGACNAKLDDADKIWYQDGEKKLPADLAQYPEANKVTLVNVSNVNITTSAQSADWDFLITFAPVATNLEKSDKWDVVCTTKTHMSDSYTPSTWAVNTDWLAKNEDLFKKFMVALVEGMNFRRDNVEETTKDIEYVSKEQISADSLATDIAVWLGDKEQLELDKSGDMMKYAENIYNSQKNGANGSKVVKSLKDSVDFSYLLDACNTVLGK